MTLPAISRGFHHLDEVLSLSGVAAFAMFSVLVAFIGIALRGFDTRLQTGFATISSGITVSMVFVLQHTQRRAQMATQLKLDELIRALPEADNRIVHIEASSNHELVALEEQRLQMHSELRTE